MAMTWCYFCDAFLNIGEIVFQRNDKAGNKDSEYPVRVLERMEYDPAISRYCYRVEKA